MEPKERAHLLARSSVGETSAWARLGSTSGVLEGQTQAGHTGLLAGDPGKESTSELMQVVGRIHLHVGLD